jgi:membrane protease YdiL (CAAX protease family)
MSSSTPAPIPGVSRLEQSGLLPSEAEGQGKSLRHLQHLALVLWVSFSIPVTRSIYYLVEGSPVQAYTPMQQQYRLAAGLIEEASALFLLWYVMGRQGKTRRDIGWNPQLADLSRALGLFLLVIVAGWFVYYGVQYLYYAHSGHYLAARSLYSMLGFGVSALSIAYACLNPFCEELIVRAYTITEVLSLGGTRKLAVVTSVVVQLSYHLYQGWVNVLWLTPIFLVVSIYYVRTRRIVPVILVHLAMDLWPLLRGTLER